MHACPGVAVFELHAPRACICRGAGPVCMPEGGAVPWRCASQAGRMRLSNMPAGCGTTRPSAAPRACFFAEGVRLCEELARAFRPYKVYYLDSRMAEAAALGGEACEVSLPVAQKLAGTRTPQGLFALFPCPVPMPRQAFTGKGRYLCLERVQDPSNLWCARAQRGGFRL